MAHVEVLAWAAAVEAVVRLASSLSARPPPRSLPPLPPLAQGAVAEEPPPLSTARHLALSPIAPAAFGRGLRMREGV